MGVGVGFNYYVSNHCSYYPYFSYSYQYTTIGVAQIFLLGGSIAMSNKIKLTIAFEKIGFDNLQYQYDVFDGFGVKVGEGRIDYVPQSGFDDVGITMGVRLSL
jgi:hypothetical protein